MALTTLIDYILSVWNGPGGGSNKLLVDSSGSTSTVSGTVGANQGNPNSAANGWPVKPTDGTNSQGFLATGEGKVSITQPIAAGTNSIGQVTANAGTNLNTSALALDTTVNGLLKPASTLNAVTSLGSITGALPTGANTIGKTDQGVGGSSPWLVKEQAKLVSGTTFDTIQVTAVNGNDDPTTILYKTGGLAGSTVATLTIAYDGSGNFQSVVKT